MIQVQSHASRPRLRAGVLGANQVWPLVACLVCAALLLAPCDGAVDGANPSVLASPAANVNALFYCAAADVLFFGTDEGSSPTTIGQYFLKTGVMTTAGNALVSSTDGVQLGPGSFVATADCNTLYIADHYLDTIRKLVISPRSLTVVAGSGAGVYRPLGLALDEDARRLYFSNFFSVKSVDLANPGTTTLIAGGGTAGYNSMSGAAAQFNPPFGIGLMSPNYLLVVDQASALIRRVEISTGVVADLAGQLNSPTANPRVDGIGAAAALQGPKFAHYSPNAGALYFVQPDSNPSLRKFVVATNNVSTLYAASGYTLGGVAVDPTRARAYVARKSAGDVVGVDLDLPPLGCFAGHSCISVLGGSIALAGGQIVLSG